MNSPGSIALHLVHSAPTPHNNYLLDALAMRPDVNLFRHYLFKPSQVPGRPWNSLSAGEIQRNNIRTGVSKYFDFKLIKLALFDKTSVFFVIGWDYPILILLLFIIGIRRRPLLMWDDGPTPEAIEHINSWYPRHLLKKVLIRLINGTPGAYFFTGGIAKAGIITLGVNHLKLLQMPFFVKPAAESEGLRINHSCDTGSAFLFAGGRLIPQKGFDVFISALGLLKNEGCSGWKATIVGSGSIKEDLTNLALRLCVEDSISFVDWAEPELFASYIHSCDIFVAPARFDHFPTTVIAAMQAGKAVVATDKVGSAVEFIETGTNGLIVPADDPIAMAKALKQLIENTDMRGRMAEAGQKTMREWPVERGVQLIVRATNEALGLCAAS